MVGKQQQQADIGRRKLERRKLLSWLCASPILAASGISRAQLELSEYFESEAGSYIQSPEQALSLEDFKLLAESLLPPAHLGYLKTGVLDNKTRDRNEDAFDLMQMHVKRLSGVSATDTRLKLLGKELASPILLAPTSSQGAFHVEAELAMARGAARQGHMPIVANFATQPLDSIVEAYGSNLWYQLYPGKEWSVTRRVIEQAESAGCKTLFVTVDMFGGSIRNEAMRLRQNDNRQCDSCHQAKPGSLEGLRLKPALKGLGFQGLATAPTWELISRIKETSNMNLVVKGIMTPEDARQCIEYGADALVVSNHGGRAFESGRSTIESLPEIVEAVQGKIPVLIDGGFRRGTDVYKALALGADAVCIGRPYLWGLTCFGEQGVATVLQILQAELEYSMRKMGAASLMDIRPESVQWL